MNNSWNNEQPPAQYNMMPMNPNVMMGMQQMQQMQSMQNAMRMMQASAIINDYNQPAPVEIAQPSNNNQQQPFIGPVDPKEKPDEDKGKSNEKRHSNRSDRKDRDNKGDRSRHARTGRDRSRSRTKSDRKGRWSDNNDVNAKESFNMPSMMPGNMMPAFDPNMSGQPMDPGMGMPHNPHMANMQMPMMQGMMVPNAMPNMMDPNMMMPQMQMQQPRHPIYFSLGVLMPPAPGMPVPTRREKPPGCRTIFVGGLPHNISKDLVHEIFQHFGMIEEVKIQQGVCHVRFENQESLEQCFYYSGGQLKPFEAENETTTIWIDYALNRDDQDTFERSKRRREPTPPRVERYSPAALAALGDKIKCDADFPEAAATLASWLERGECNKKNANVFYSLVQTANNQIRRLYNDKMQIDEEYQNLKTAMKDRFAAVIQQFQQVAKILSVAKHQRVSDHFSKQQRRNIEMWLKMTEELENMKDEFNAYFDDDDEKVGRNGVPQEKYDQLKAENESLVFELEGYKNETYIAKTEAERKFEKFKAQFIAQQALQHNKPFTPLPQMPVISMDAEDNKKPLQQSEAKIISILTAFLLAHPVGAPLNTILTYAQSILPHTSEMNLKDILTKYTDIFGIVRNDNKINWSLVIFNSIKK